MIGVGGLQTQQDRRGTANIMGDAIFRGNVLLCALGGQQCWHSERLTYIFVCDNGAQ